MSKTRHGFNCAKGPRGSYRQVKKIAQGKLRMREKALCKKAMDGDDISPIDFPMCSEFGNDYSVPVRY